MTGRMMKVSMAAVAAVAAAVVTPAAAHATGAGLWTCSPFADGSGPYACTTITSAPNGVQVKDHRTGRIFTLHDGDSVALLSWSLDQGQPPLCGTTKDRYVWDIGWQNGGEFDAKIGDVFLNTGKVSNWNDYIVDGWNLGSQHWKEPDSSGTCDVY